LIVMMSTGFLLLAFAVSFRLLKNEVSRHGSIVVGRFQSILDKTLGDMTFLTQLSTIQAALKFHAPEAAEKILNHAIREEAHLIALVILDRNDNTFTSNNLSPEGAFINEQTEIQPIHWSLLTFRKVRLHKHGEVGFYIPVEYPTRLLLSKIILDNDVSVGRMIAVIDTAQIYNTLLKKHALNGAIEIRQTDFAGTASNYAFCTALKIPGIFGCGVLIPRQVFIKSAGWTILSAILGVFISLLVYLLVRRSKTIQQDLAIKEAKCVLATQVAHDIRSPLTALGVAAEDLSGLPENRRTLIRSAIRRIHDIADNLLALQVEDVIGGKPSHESRIENPHSPQLLSCLIDTLLTEKRLQYQSKALVDIVNHFG